MAKRGLYSNIHAKRKRIKAGSGEKMRKPGSKVRLRLKRLSSQLKLRRSGNGNGRVQRQESYVK